MPSHRMIARETVFAAIDHLRSSGRFVEAWGEHDDSRVLELEALLGGSLPEDFRAFVQRYANLNLGYRQINGLGPVAGAGAAAELTLERRREWPSLPRDSVVLGEENTDMYVLRGSGAVEVRTESSRDLAVVSTFPDFHAFLVDSVLEAAEHAKGLGIVPADYEPWQ